MKNIVNFLFCAASCIGFAKAADNPTADELLISEGPVSITQHFVSENNYEIILKTSEKNSRTIWKSFWGRCRARLSPNGKFAVMEDDQRWRLSPIILFKLAEPAIIYETPGSFQHQEKNFTYTIGSITDSSLEVIVLSNTFGDESSRPSQKEVMRYKVEFKTQREIVPEFYRNTELFFGISK